MASREIRERATIVDNKEPEATTKRIEMDDSDDFADTRFQEIGQRHGATIAVIKRPDFKSKGLKTPMLSSSTMEKFGDPYKRFEKLGGESKPIKKAITLANTELELSSPPKQISAELDDNGFVNPATFARARSNSLRNRIRRTGKYQIELIRDSPGRCSEGRAYYETDEYRLVLVHLQPRAAQQLGQSGVEPARRPDPEDQWH